MMDTTFPHLSERFVDLHFPFVRRLRVANTILRICITIRPPSFFSNSGSSLFLVEQLFSVSRPFFQTPPTFSRLSPEWSLSLSAVDHTEYAIFVVIFIEDSPPSSFTALSPSGSEEGRSCSEPEISFFKVSPPPRLLLNVKKIQAGADLKSRPVNSPDQHPDGSCGNQLMAS